MSAIPGLIGMIERADLRARRRALEARLEARLTELSFAAERALAAHSGPPAGLPPAESAAWLGRLLHQLLMEACEAPLAGLVEELEGAQQREAEALAPLVEVIDLLAPARPRLAERLRGAVDPAGRASRRSELVGQLQVEMGLWSLGQGLLCLGQPELPAIDAMDEEARLGRIGELWGLHIAVPAEQRQHLLQRWTTGRARLLRLCAAQLDSARPAAAWPQVSP
jgi:hypothetical protein